MSHHDEHRSCEAVASSSGRIQEHVVESSSHAPPGGVLSDTDSGVTTSDTEDVAARTRRLRTPVSSSSGGARPRTSAASHSATPAPQPSSSSSVDLHTLRDPSDYEELNVIGTGEFQSAIPLG